MQEYKSGRELIAEIERTAKLFIAEFDSVEEMEKNKILEGADRSPMQMIAYQLGWMHLIMKWDANEREGKEVITPSPDYKWNSLGGLYDSFYREYASYSLDELKDMFEKTVAEMLVWIKTFSEQELFGQEARKWASSTPSRWPVWKWIHINTVAPFKSFRGKIRKWKRLRAEQ
ncbi:MAG: ClbS/DfsB family four-helix bundle protein [Lacrimispora sp.]